MLRSSSGVSKLRCSRSLHSTPQFLTNLVNRELSKDKRSKEGIIYLPKYFRLKQLAASLAVSTKQLLEDIVIHHRKKIYCQFDGLWFQFPSSKHIIIPSSFVTAYAKNVLKGNKRADIIYRDEVEDLAKAVAGNFESLQKTPIIVCLGHFNHGKTSLLDALIGHKSKIVDSEKHGITQIIRTRLLTMGPEANATFVDTPGQEIFYRMRNYGAMCGDIVLLVIAADDGICTQTQESIGIIDSLKVPVVVCINKVDILPPETVQQRLQELEQSIREYVSLKNAKIFHISATMGHNIDILKSHLAKKIHAFNESNPNTDADKMLPSSSTESNLKAEDNYLKNISSGSVLNVSVSKQQGTALQTIIKRGKIQIGDYFSSSGWSGYIRNIVLHNDASAKEASTKDSAPQYVKQATAGMAVDLLVALDKDSSDPRPLGDNIYFYPIRQYPKITDSSDVSSTTKVPSNSKDSLEITLAQEISYRLADQERMQAALGNYLIAESTAQEYGLYKQALYKRKSRKLTGLDSHGVAHKGAQETSEDNDVIEYQDDLEEEQYNSEVPNVVIKAESDIAIATLQDAFDGAEDIISGEDEPSDSSSSTSPAFNVVLWEVGNVTLKNVMVAKAAKAKIIVYGSAFVEPDASRQMQHIGLKLTRYDRMQDVINLLTGTQGHQTTTNTLPAAKLISSSKLSATSSSFSTEFTDIPKGKKSKPNI